MIISTRARVEVDGAREKARNVGIPIAVSGNSIATIYAAFLRCKFKYCYFITAAGFVEDVNLEFLRVDIKRMRSAGRSYFK